MVSIYTLPLLQLFVPRSLFSEKTLKPQGEESLRAPRAFLPLTRELTLV